MLGFEWVRSERSTKGWTHSGGGRVVGFVNIHLGFVDLGRRRSTPWPDLGRILLIKVYASMSEKENCFNFCRTGIRNFEGATRILKIIYQLVDW